MAIVGETKDISVHRSPLNIKYYRVADKLAWLNFMWNILASLTLFFDHLDSLDSGLFGFIDFIDFIDALNIRG